MFSSHDITVLLLSLGPGAMLGLLALGLVTIYRSTGILNLAHTAFATLGAYAYYDLTEHGWPKGLALTMAMTLVGLVAVVAYVLALRPLRSASPLTKLAATAGILIVVQSALQLRYGSVFRGTESWLPKDSVELFGTSRVGVDRIILFVIAVIGTLVLWSVYRYTRFGLATVAAAENPVVGSAFGLRSERLAIGNWFIGGALAGGAGALLAPIAGLSLTQFSSLIVPVLAAALVGSLTSFPLALLGGLLIGASQAYVSTNTTTRGAADIVPLGVIVAMMVWRGSSIPTRSAVGLRLPSLGSGRVRPLALVLVAGGAIASVYTWLPSDLLRPLLANLTVASVLLSLVVVTGYAGQVSLAQYAFAGFGAYVASWMMDEFGWHFFAAAPVSVAAAAVLGLALALPSLRMRGVSLAVVTLGFAVMMNSVLFTRTETVTVDTPSLFGIDLSLIRHPERYITFTIVVITACSLVVANLRRSRSGRRMIAVRGNERAAASLGVSVAATKLTAFSVSAALAAVGGILISFQTPVISYSNYNAFASINALGWSVIGGVGYVTGPLLGSLFSPATLGSKLGDAIYDNAAVLGVVGGVAVIITLVLHPDGIASLPRDLREHLRHRRHSGEPDEARACSENPAVLIEDRARRDHVHPLELVSVSVAFGGVKALTDVSLTVVPGSVHGLIGPNGAGKTTLLDVVSGFTLPTDGSVRIGGNVVDAVPAWRRARLGLGRSFQNVQLFPDLDVLENIRVAAEQGQPDGSLVTDLLRPEKLSITSIGMESIEELGLADDLHRNVDELTHGQRQLVAIARSLAADPGIVMLDEPAAGLDEVERTELATLLRRLAAERNIGVLLVEHDVDLVLGVSDWVTVLHRGRVLASGPPDEIRKNPQVIEAYLGTDTESTKGEMVNV